MTPWGTRTLAVLAVATMIGCASGPPAPDDSGYITTLAEGRAEKDVFFRNSPETPIPPDKQGVLLPLPYYPIDAAYIVPAALKLADERPVFEMPTSTGSLRRYQLVGSVEFSLRGQPMSLGAFIEEGQAINELFVPFADMTTGQETYSAGRYLSLTPTSSGLYTIDFNTAYNPYCAYNSRYDCPFPPPSNRLQVPIRAGEKAPGA